MSLNHEDLEYLAKEIPRLTSAFSPAPSLPAQTYAVQCRWTEAEVKTARLLLQSLSETPLDRALEWLREPQGEMLPTGEPWVSGVRTDFLADAEGTESECLVIVVARAFA